MHSAEKKAILDAFRAIEFQKREAMYRNVRQIMALLVKISKLTTLYPVEDPVYDEFVETMKTNLDAIGNTLPVFAINVKKVGFYYVEKRLKILDEGEKDFRNLFIVNEIRELAFIKGISSDEIRRFFSVLAKMLSYTGAEYDFNTLMWDLGISHIVCMSDQDTGEPENIPAKDLPDLFSPLPPVAAIDLEEMGELAREFDGLFKGAPEALKNFLDANGDLFTVKKYLLVLSRMIPVEEDRTIARRLIDQLVEYAEKLILELRVTYGLAFLATLTELEPKLAETQDPLHERVAQQLQTLRSESFADALFDRAVKLPPAEIESFGIFLTMVSPLYFEKVFMRLTELNSRDIRLPCLKGIAKDFTDIETAKRLLEHENWHIVRNALYLLRFTYNERFVQMVRTVMNHEQKQIRVEASVVLSKYDADDNMPYWQKAVFSPDKEVRVVAVKSVVKIKDTQAKNILDTVLRPQNIAKLAPDEIPLFFEIVVESGRGEFFDLIGVHLFSEERKLRFAAIAAIRTMPPTETIWRLIAKRVASEDFRSLDKEEIDKTLALIREDSVQMIVPALDYVFTLQGGMFDRTKFRPFKEAVFFQVGRLRKAKFVQRWLARAREEGNPETREILEKLGIKS